MPSYLPGVFVVLAGLAMIIGRKPLSLMQYAALKQACVTTLKMAGWAHLSRMGKH